MAAVARTPGLSFRGLLLGCGRGAVLGQTVTCRYQAQRGAAKLDSEARSGAGADRNAGVIFSRRIRISVVFFNKFEAFYMLNNKLLESVLSQKGDRRLRHSQTARP